MGNVLSVKEVAKHLGKSEETVKRWLRAGKFPNAYNESDKQGWKIPSQDLKSLEPLKLLDSQEGEQFIREHPPLTSNSSELKELVSLAYQAVTMTSPTEQILKYLQYIGIKRTLEILLIMQQSPNKVKNPEGFIKKAIINGWKPTTLPIKIERNVARNPRNIPEETQRPPVPYYNWLEQD